MVEVPADQVRLFNAVIEAINKDAAAFKADPKGKVPGLKPGAVTTFKAMSIDQLNRLPEIDKKMAAAGFGFGEPGLSARMV